jgi:trimethylamine---corrinoid protein Co-methyltransferase
LQGFEVNEETIALDVIKQVGIGGSYLTHPHTSRNFRKEFYLSDLMERMSWESWNKQKIRGFEAKAKERARHILETHHPQPLSEEQIKAIDEIVASAKRDPWYQSQVSLGGG